MEVLEQQPCISNADTDLKNKYNDNTFLSKSISTEQNYPALWNITKRSYQDLDKITVLEKYSIIITMWRLTKFSLHTLLHFSCVYIFALKLDIPLNIIHGIDTLEFEHFLP